MVSASGPPASATLIAARTIASWLSAGRRGARVGCVQIDGSAHMNKFLESGEAFCHACIHQLPQYIKYTRRVSRPADPTAWQSAPPPALRRGKTANTGTSGGQC